MGDPHEAKPDLGHKEEFQLKIISPSPGIGPLNFPTISTSCTVAQLKQKISDASETKVPLPSQQRLIYRGHVLAQEQRTLEEVFGRDTIDHTSEPFTIHLAFNPGLNQNHASSSSTFQPRTQQAPPVQASQADSNAPHLPTSSNTPSHTASGPSPQEQPRFGQPFQTQVPQQNPFPQMQQAFAIMNQQIAAQMAALNAPTPATLQSAMPAQSQGQPPQSQHNSQPPQLPQLHNQSPRLQNDIPQSHPHTHQPSSRLGSPLPASPHMTPQQALQQNIARRSALRNQHQPGTASPDQESSAATTPRSNSAPPPGLGNTNTVIRETYGPNGERHQSIVSSGTFQLNRGIQLPNVNFRHRGTTGPTAFTPSASAPGTPSANVNIPNQQFSPQEHGLSGPASSDLRIQLIQSHMLSMELAMNLGTTPPQSVQDQIHTLLQSVAATMAPQEYRNLEMRRALLFERASQMRRHHDARLQRAAEQLTSQGAAQSTEESAVYLLSSPDGPQALLISPLGHYAAPWPAPLAPAPPPMGLPNPLVANAAQNGLIRAQQAQLNAVQLAQARPDELQGMFDQIQRLADPGHRQPHPIPNGQPLAQRNGQAPNPAGDIARILLPLGGPLWLLIRLFGFVYFFTHGASWQRTIFLSLVATLLFIAQTGLFQPLLQNLWGPIRRHMENLLPLAGNEPPHRRNAPPGNNAGGSGTQGRNQEPTPEQAAERLLRERQAQDGNLLRQSLRRIERAVALFVASLVPGVGERHIAAREAAEALRQQQERERDERVRREEEERARRDEGEPQAGENEERLSTIADPTTTTEGEAR